MRVKILVLGCGGVVGYHLLTELKQAGHEAVGVARKSAFAQEKMDVTQLGALEQLFAKYRPQVVINAIKPALSVDAMEQKKEETSLINAELPKQLAMLQSKFGYKLVQISTGGLYEGKEGVLYGEDAPLFAHNHYFKTKLEAERAVQEHSNNFIIARTEGVFGFDERGANPFLRLYKAAREKTPYQAATDQMAQPISGAELARALRLLIEKNAKGIYNVVGPDYCSRHELAEIMCKEMGWKVQLQAVSIKVRKIFMPPCLKLDTGKLQKEIGPLKPLQQQIAELKNRPDAALFLA
ncbi:MAG: SDR family oxidoreductase [Candidatus Marsarchaeota archaeon]|nr:SDR family oxidoreductase [Candidatus Marsarchaeota archaeon]